MESLLRSAIGATAMPEFFIVPGNGEKPGSTIIHWGCPTPVRETDGGFAIPWIASDSEAWRGPRADGRKSTCTEQEAPGCRIVPQVLPLSSKSNQLPVLICQGPFQPEKGRMSRFPPLVS